MRNLVYQYWNGSTFPGVEYSKKNIKQWCDRIGVEYLFETNQNWAKGLGKYTPHYGVFKICHDKYFEQYDNILYLDCDVYSVDNLKEDIFDIFYGDIAIAKEPFQPKNRVKMNGHSISNQWDEKWLTEIKKQYSVDLPRTKEGLPEVFNSGVVLFSRNGRDIVKNNFVSPKEYISFARNAQLPEFYYGDQNYLHCMIFVNNMNFQVLDSNWNSLVHGYWHDGVSRKIMKLNDERSPNTKLVHVQLNSADHWKEDVLHDIVNKPIDKWPQLYNIPNSRLIPKERI